VLLEHRALFEESAPVPAEPYALPVGAAAVVRPGRDVTVVAISQMVGEALKAADRLAAEDVSVEVVDPRWLAPLDEETILASVRRTTRLVVADTAWTSFGVSAEIAARAAERLFGVLSAPVARIALPDVPTPCSSALERAYYPGAPEIAAAVRRLLGFARTTDPSARGSAESAEFKGPF